MSKPMRPLFDQPMPAAASGSHSAPGGSAPVAANAARPAGPSSVGYQNMLHLIQLRWIAVIGQVSTIAGVSLSLHIALPLDRMLAVVASLTLFNLVSRWYLRQHRRVTNRAMLLALLVDVASLTAQLHYSGGASNPFAFLFLLQVILSAVLLRAWSTWIIVAITSACLAGLARYSTALPLPHEYAGHYFSLYVQGMLICFVLNAALLVVFITRINTNLRAGDAQLAHLRQRAAEEEHIVRMGLLASGAAHELGTPLATLSVILGDWRRMPALRADPDLLEEIGEMQAQLQRCKAIVSGILLSAGEARGESSMKTSLHRFLDQLVAEWRSSRAVIAFDYHNRLPQDLPVVFDSTLKQMICNVLDNALEASPAWLAMEVTQRDDWLHLAIVDAGPGFTPAMLTQYGTPYMSSKGRPGGGLGLFLSVNVARTLGGTVTVRNRAAGGALVELALPLAAIALAGESDDGN